MMLYSASASYRLLYDADQLSCLSVGLSYGQQLYVNGTAAGFSCFVLFFHHLRFCLNVYTTSCPKSVWLLFLKWKY